MRKVFSVTKEKAVILTHALRLGGFEDRALGEFYPYDELADDPTNWWVPNMKMLIGWCEAAGFGKVDMIMGPHEQVELGPGESDRYTAILHAYR
jgi:hypothetical protein